MGGERGESGTYTHTRLYRCSHTEGLEVPAKVCTHIQLYLEELKGQNGLPNLHPICPNAIANQSVQTGGMRNI